jgi:hypothetical protein
LHRDWAPTSYDAFFMEFVRYFLRAVIPLTLLVLAGCMDGAMVERNSQPYSQTDTDVRINAEVARLRAVNPQMSGNEAYETAKAIVAAEDAALKADQAKKTAPNSDSSGSGQ